MLPENGRPNVFAGPHVDRLKPPRSDPAVLQRALEARQGWLVPIWRSRCLLTSGPAARAHLLPLQPQIVGAAGAAALILLGEFRGAAVFAIELNAEVPPEPVPDAEFAELRHAAGVLAHDEAGLLAYARAMINFHKRHRYCGSCGAPTEPRQGGHVLSCSDARCAAEAFPRLDPAVIVLVSDGDRALLGRQASWPAGRFSTIAGFVEPGESLEDAVRREALEETGIQVGAMKYESSQPWPFPASLMIGFQAQATSTAITLGDDELEDAQWFSRADIAAGNPTLPFRQSLSYRLIEDWYDAGSARPMSEEPAVHGWVADGARDPDS